jgi:hypothetical protein
MGRGAELGAIMDVGAWLRSLGLERYEAAFRENEIDGTVLPSLTADDLKDLGAGIVGQRRKLLDAIAALRADVSAKPAPPVTLPGASTSLPLKPAARDCSASRCDIPMRYGTKPAISTTFPTAAGDLVRVHEK